MSAKSLGVDFQTIFDIIKSKVLCDEKVAQNVESKSLCDGRGAQNIEF